MVKTMIINTHAINWNTVPDPLDLEIWKRLTTNFWLPEKISLANDLPSWQSLTKKERKLVIRVFAGLTLLDTIQSVHGVPAMIPDAVTDHEAAVLTNIAFMEAVHAKSYSYIFSTLCTSQEINDAFEWCYQNTTLQEKARTIRSIYVDLDALKKKVASTFLEGMMFYSGFYLPLYYASRNKLPNTADIIRLIIRDEAIHGYYIGYKFQMLCKKLNEREKQRIDDFVYGTLKKLIQIEIKYTHEIYGADLSRDVIGFVKYNANKALANLGYNALYKKSECGFDDAVLASLAPQSNENHDFFSSAGSTYIMGKAADIQDEDWAF